MSKRAVRVYLDFANIPQAQRLRQMLPDACRDTTHAERHADVTFEDIPARADILVTDRPGAFDGLEPINGQLFVIAHRHSHSLESHFRTVDPDIPIRRLIKIVREQYQLQHASDFRADRDPEPLVAAGEVARTE